MAFYFEAKKPGDLMKSDEWNSLNAEVVRLGTDKIDRTGDAVKGDLTVTGKVNVSGPLSVTGASTLTGNTSVGGTLSVTGLVAFNNNVNINGSLSVTANKELLFADNGQIRSGDNNHRILFRRSENKLELREFGQIVFSPGATAGAETAKVLLAENGKVGIGAATPEGALHLNRGAADAQVDVDNTNTLPYGTEKADLVLTRRHSPTKSLGNQNGWAASLIDFRATNASEEWSLAQILGVADLGASGGYAGGLAFLTSAGGTNNPAGSRTQGSAPVVRMAIDANGNVGVGTVSPAAKLEIVGRGSINDGNGYAVKSNFMANGSLTIGNITTNYGGGSGWSANTAGLLLETQTNTEIAVHDSGTRIASLLYYEGDAANRITIGRDMGWGPISTVAVAGYLAAKPVYFSAYVDQNTRSGTLNPLPMQVVSQNVGDGFDVNSSKFTAPVRGVYLFTMTGLRVEGSSDFHWQLMVNDNYANSGPAEGGERCLLTWIGAQLGTCSRTLLVFLNQGDRVHILQSGSGRCDNFRSGLEGVLLSASL